MLNKLFRDYDRVFHETFLNWLNFIQYTLYRIYSSKWHKHRQILENVIYGLHEWFNLRGDGNGKEITE